MAVTANAEEPTPMEDAALRQLRAQLQAAGTSPQRTLELMEQARELRAERLSPADKTSGS